MQYNVMNPNWYWDLPKLPAGVAKVDKALGYDDPSWSTANVAKVNAQQQQYANMLFDLYQPDILLLNERFTEWNTFTASLTKNKGYAIVETIASGHKICTNPILYKTSEFTLVKSGVFDYSTSSIANTDNDKEGYRVMTWAILKSKATGKSILVCNMHLQATNSTYTALQNAQFRVNQANAIADEIAKILSQNTSVKNLIVGGDMNSIRGVTRDEYEAQAGSAYDALLGRLIAKGLDVSHAYSSTDYGIDNFATMGCTVNQTGTDRSHWTDRVSDHCPIYADITLK